MIARRYRAADRGLTVALGVLTALAHGCTRATPCDERAVLGTVSESGAPIRLADVEALVVRARMSGIETAVGASFVDLMWQEAARQRLGLPGGDQASASWQIVVRRHARGLDQGRPITPAVQRAELPPDARLTACGAALVPASTL
jgi:hypothetical protein